MMMSHSRTMPNHLILLLMLCLLSPTAVIAGFLSDDSTCDDVRLSAYHSTRMDREIAAFQTLAEQALALRADAISFLKFLEEKDAAGEPLSGGDLRGLNAGGAELLRQREALWEIATRYECWLDDPIPQDPARARLQAKGIGMSLAASLTLYDNYVTAVGLYQANGFLRTHFNRGDVGFGLPPGELRKISLSFNSAINRARVRRGLEWYETFGGSLHSTGDDDARYIGTLIDQSPSYNMVRKIQPLNYAQNLMGFFGDLSVDTLASLQNEGVNFSSMMFGNTVGLIESRRGKLDGETAVLDEVANTLRAGDILLEKTPFRLTDSFIPGHWGHAAVWVGNEQELRALGIWSHPVVRQYHKQIRRGRGVVEALRSGVEINSLQHFMNIDDLAVLRNASLDEQQRADVIVQALRQVGKDYDFNFDTQSTDRIVCSELVYHAYGTMQWPTERQLGRYTVSPDNIAVLATDDGPLEVMLLYHDGKAIDSDPRASFANLLQPETVTMARGGPSLIEP